MSELTPSQNNAVFEDVNCVVSAGAGSGKTRVLAERFVRLVNEEKAHSNEILTLTFTRKATSEMKERIYKNLLVLNKPKELELFSDCAISTVDSLCAEIVRSCCHSYGISSEFTILDSEDYTKYAVDLAYKFISERKDSQFIKRILKYYSPDALCKMLADTIEKNLNIVCSFDPDNSASEYIRLSKEAAENQREIIVLCAQDFIDNYSSDEKLKTQTELLNSFLNHDINVKDIVFDKSRGSKENQESAKDLRDKIKNARNNYIAYISSVENSDFTYAFYRVVNDFKKEVDSFKRKNSSLLYSDIMALTLEILLHNKEVRTWYKNKYKFIMIDEFQDNNDDYRKLIYLLSEKYSLCLDRIPQSTELEQNKIFLVGDQKQSIYRFRGADVSVFKRISNELQNSGGTLIELDKNFRSTPKLVNAFNTIFDSVMKNSSNDYEADFKPLISNEENNLSSRIVFNNCFIDNSKEDNSQKASAELSEAFSIASLIKEIVGNDKWLIKGNAVPKYSDIAILLRQGVNQADYEKALRINNIPYTLSEPRSLSQEALVNDFYNALQLCIFPYDELSKVAYERSPLGSSDISGLANVVKQGSISGAVSYIWNKMGYRYFIIGNPANQAYKEHYNWLFSLASYYDSNEKDFVQFLDYLRPMLGKSQKFRELPVLKENSNSGVQIMTIHKSKGLEFPIVIIADMQGGHNSVRGIFSASYKNNLLYLPCNISAKGGLKCLCDITDPTYEARLEDAETKRVLYVAATRAESHLVFSCCIRPKHINDSDSESHINNMAKFFLDACPFDFEKQQFTDQKHSFIEPRQFSLIDQNETFSTQRLTQERIKTVSQWYNCEDDNFDYSSNKTSVTALCQSETENTGTRLPKINSDCIIRDYSLQTEFGTLTHAYIEAMIKKNAEPDFKDDRLSDDEINTVRQDAKMLAQAFVNSNLYKSIQDCELYSERSFVVFRENHLVEGTIDLYAVRQGEITLLDFKTDSFKNPLVHQAQLAYYSDALKSMYPDSQVNSQIVYLREFVFGEEK